MVHSFVAYIDESGDDGIANFRSPGNGGASQWLTLGCCIVSRQNDLLVPGWRDEILAALRRTRMRTLHFADLKHEQKVVACEHLARQPFRGVVVMSNKTTIPRHPRKDLFQPKNTLYWYLARYVIERISQFCERRAVKTDGDGTAKIVFSRRGGMQYDDFKAYLYRLRQNDGYTDEPAHIRWQHIDIESVAALDHGARAGLQLADIIASAFSAAVEPNGYGNFEPRYARALAGRMMIAADGRILGAGVKPVPRLDQMVLSAAQIEFFEGFRK